MALAGNLAYKRICHEQLGLAGAGCLGMPAVPLGQGVHGAFPRSRGLHDEGGTRGLCDEPSGPSLVSSFLSRPLVRRVLGFALSLVLSANLLFYPKFAYADTAQLVGIALTLTDAFVATAFGVSTAALAPIYIPAKLMTVYGRWAEANPDLDAEFRQYLTDNVFSTSGLVGDSYEDICIPLENMPLSIKESFIDCISSEYSAIGTRPIVPAEITLPFYFPVVFRGGSINGNTVNYTSAADSWISSNRTPYVLAGYNIRNGRTYYYFFDSPVLLSQSGSYITINASYGSVSWATASLTATASSYGSNSLNSGQSFNIRISPYAPEFYSCSSIDFGSGFQSTSAISLAPSVLSGVFNDFLSGVGTSADVVSVADTYAGAVKVPGVTVSSEGVVSNVPEELASTLTYDDLVYSPSQWDAIENGGEVAPSVPSDVLGWLSSIYDGIVSNGLVVQQIPPLLADLPNVLDGLEVIPQHLVDISDYVEVLPQFVQDAGDFFLDLPQTITDALDGLIVDIPPAIHTALSPDFDAIGDALDDIYSRVGSAVTHLGQLALDIPGIRSVADAISTSISGVQSLARTISDTLADTLTRVDAIPRSIASALSLDWALDNLAELDDDLDLDLDTPSPFLLPQSTWPELVAVAQDFGNLTPAGLLVTVVTRTTDVMGGGSSGGSSVRKVSRSGGAPSYEIQFPAPINASFTVDFGTFPSEFPMVTHAVFYMLFVYWYLKFVRRCRAWYSDWMGVFGSDVSKPKR